MKNEAKDIEIKRKERENYRNKNKLRKEKFIWVTVRKKLRREE
jgi:hypothetical protein